MATNNTPQEEQIELGKLFALIGNGIKNMFISLFNLFKKVLHYLILLVIFIKKHAIKLAAAVIVGGVLGYVLEMDKEPDYVSNMYVETNLGVGHQIYNQTTYLNTLIGNENTDKLASLFNITKDEAKTLTGFLANPYDTHKNMLLEYDYYMQHTDTIYTRDFTVDDFKERMNDPDYRFQIISAYSSDRTIFPKLNKGVIDLIENDHYKNLLKIKNDELNYRKLILENSLKQIDSIRNRYNKVALLNAQKKGSEGTNINLSDKLSSRNKDLDLFGETNRILGGLRSIDNEKIRNGFIVSVQSEFNIGEEYGSLLSQKWLRYAVLFGGLMFLLIVGLKFNKYLENYKK